MSRTLALFNGRTASFGDEPWLSDGTALGTGLLADLRLGPRGGSSPDEFTELGHGLVVFRGFNAAGQRVLFITDGTAGGTAEVRAFASTYRLGRFFYDDPLFGLTQLAPGKVLFTADDGTTGRQLWGSDGTAAGTTLLANINPASPDFANIKYITPLGNGRAVFQATDPTGTDGLFVTDGTPAGTSKVVGIAARQSLGLTAIGGGRAIFTTTAGFYVTDGTAAGTTLLRAGLTGPYVAGEFNGAAPRTSVPLPDGRTLFAGYDAVNGNALWVTDGTAAGTVLAVPTSATGGAFGIDGFQPLGGGRFLFSVAAGYDRQLWVTDGTAAGTAFVRAFASVRVGTPGTDPIATANGRAVFQADDGVTGPEPWVSDGTVAGTLLLKDIAPGSGASYPQDYTRLPSGQVLFSANVWSDLSNRMLWSTDGTSAGTAVISGVDATLPSGVVSVRGPDPLFDEAYYLAQNPDVAASRLDPYQHWLRHGVVEGRNPDAFFDTRYYLTQNPDVAVSGLNPLTHYETYGWREGRDPSLLFSTRAYQARNPDVGASFDPLEHFLYYGQDEGRMSFLSGRSAPADPLVVASYYDPQLGATLVPVGSAAAQQAAASYNGTGWRAGLNPNALFDTRYYLASNPDVTASGLNPVAHYELHGWTEGRDPSASFSTTRYLAANPDVNASGLDPLQHYLQYGQAEGRAVFPT